MTDTDTEDDAAFMQALTRHQRDLRAFILGMTPSVADADDVLQEVNLALWKKRRLYDRGQGFLRWAFGFAAMEVRNFRNRSAKSKVWFNDEVLELVAEAYPQDSQLVEQRRDALSNCVQKLSTTERQFVTDFYRNQCSAQALADNSGKPVSTVYKTLTRARLALRACIERTLAQQSRPA
jgi:RNA polymerase sigma-70 factor (ECF subfamily)